MSDREHRVFLSLRHGGVTGWDDEPLDNGYLIQSKVRTDSASYRLLSPEKNVLEYSENGFGATAKDPDGELDKLQRGEYRALARLHCAGLPPYHDHHCGGAAVGYGPGHAVYDYIEAKFNSNGPLRAG